MGKQTKEKEEPKREAIKRVALDCFLKYGFRGTTIAEIARASDNSKPLVMYHYKTTDEILLELMKEWALSGQGVTIRHMQTLLGKPPEDIIVALMDANSLWMKEHPKMAAFSPILLQASFEIKEVKDFLTEVFTIGRSRIETLLLQIPAMSKKPKREIKSLAQSIHCLIFGTILYVLSQGESEMIAATAEFNRNVIRNALS